MLWCYRGSRNAAIRFLCLYRRLASKGILFWGWPCVRPCVDDRVIKVYEHDILLVTVFTTYEQLRSNVNRLEFGVKR